MRSRVSILPLLALAALALIGCQRASGTEAALDLDGGALTVRVRAVKAKREKVAVGTVLVGTLEPYERATLASRATGDLAAVLVDRGDRIARGQLLAFVRVPGLPQQAAAAEASRKLAQAEAASHDELAQRAKAVAAANSAAIAAQDVALAEERAAAAKARIEVAAAEAMRIGAVAADARIVSPYDGVVVARLRDPGASVAAGTPIFEVAEIDKLRLVVDVPERDARFVKEGSPVTVVLPAAGDRSLSAQVSRFAPVLQTATRMLRVEIDVPSDGSLVAESDARVRFADASKAEATTIPDDALSFDHDAPVVYIAQGGRAHRVVVKTGYDDGNQVEIASGLSGTEEVLIGAPGILREGTPVEVAR
jgi:membrane fusion protein, multidrug efflux system